MRTSWPHFLRGALASAASALALVSASAQAQADAWPSARPISIVITFGAGSGSDVTARFLARTLKETLNANAIVDIKPGGAGMVGAQFAARAAPDGYTLLMGSGTVNAANYPLFRDRIPYSPTSFSTVAILYVSPAVMFVNNELTGKTFAELFASAARLNRKLSCGSGNAVTQVACEILKRKTGADLVNVPYKGNGQSLTDLASGQISIAFADMAAAAPLLARKAIRAVMVPSSTRMSSLPDVRTAAEWGLQDFEFLSWNGLFVPAGTPPDIIAKLNQAARHLLDSPEWDKQRSATSGIRVSADLASSRAFVNAEIAKWERYVRESGVKGSE